MSRALGLRSTRRHGALAGVMGAVVAVVFGGCGDSSPHDVHVTIDSSSLSDAAAASVRSLDISVSGVASANKSYPLGRALQQTERLTTHFAASSGKVTLGVVARDAQSLVVGRGTALAQLGGSGGAVTVALTGLAGGAQPSGVALTPATYSIFTNQTLALAAGEKVTWSAADGGAVDATGLYTAPATAGTYHVTARSQIYGTDTATATIDVRDSGVLVYAGTPGGAGTVDGSLAQARIASPSGIVWDAARNALFFVDQGRTVRKFNRGSGAVTTIAGRVDDQFAADGIGSGASFGLPLGLAGDGTTLYTADTDVNCVRKIVVATGEVTTLAGGFYQGGYQDGTAANARFGWVNDLVLDAANGALYVADTGANAIRKVSVSDGSTTTVAGVGGKSGATDGPASTALLQSPTSVTLDGHGHLFILDQNNSALRQIDLNAQTVTTLAQVPQGGTRLAYDPAGYLWMGWSLQRVEIATGKVTTVPLTGDANIGSMQSLTMGPNNTLLTGNDATLVSTDLATKVTTNLVGSPQIYAEVDGPPAVARLFQPQAMATRDDGSIYVRDGGALRRIDGNGTFSTVIATLPNGSAGGMAFAGGMLYLVDQYASTITRIDVDSGNYSVYAGQAGSSGYVDGAVKSARFSGPLDIVANGQTLYVTDVNNDCVRAIDLTTGTVSTLVGVPGPWSQTDGPLATARLQGPLSLAFDGADSLYVADNYSVRKIALAAATMTTVAGAHQGGFADGSGSVARLSYATRMLLDAGHQNLYIADAMNDSLRKLALGTGTLSTIAGVPGMAGVQPGALPGAINQPCGLAWSATGELLVSVPRENVILQVRWPQ